MLFISYRYEANPYVSAGVLDEFGNLVRHWGVEVPYPTMMREYGKDRCIGCKTIDLLRWLGNLHLTLGRVD